MGACSSCMGRRRQDSVDDDEVSRLLDDPNSFQYGSFNEQHMTGQADPLESQRETEALQKVVAQTSNKLVDIFNIAPQAPPPQQTHAIAATVSSAIPSQQDLHLAHFQNILSRLSPDDEGTNASGVVQGYGDWLSDDEGGDAQETSPNAKEEGAEEPLVGTFADATAAAT